jgi:hypothetical protein
MKAKARPAALSPPGPLTMRRGIFAGRRLYHPRLRIILITTPALFRIGRSAAGGALRSAGARMAGPGPHPMRLTMEPVEGIP